MKKSIAVSIVGNGNQIIKAVEVGKRLQEVDRIELIDNPDHADALVLVGGAEPERRVVEAAYERFIPMWAFRDSEGLAEQVAGEYLDNRGLIRVRRAQSDNLDEDISTIVDNRGGLIKRLSGVGLDLSIYKSVPDRFIRVNPRDPIEVNKLSERLNEVHDLSVEFSEVGLPGIYRSSVHSVGGRIRGEENPLYEARYIIQDAASSFAVYALDVESGMSYLDMCASPGVKTLLAYDLAQQDLDITAIDIKKSRIEKLKRNLERYSVAATVKNMDASIYDGPEVDRVFVDVPCSREGMIRKYNKSKGMGVSGFDSVVGYSEESLEGLKNTQSALLRNGFRQLKPGGFLVYATCSVNKKENDEVVESFLGRYRHARVDLSNIPRPSFNYQQSDLGVRVMPGETRGLFFTRIAKKAA